MRIAIITCTTSNRKWLYDITNPCKTQYAKKHGYDYIFSDSFYPDPTKGVFWLKPAFIAENISDKYDWIVWCDDDAGIIKQDFNLEEFIKSVEEPDKLVYAAEDLNGFNAGVLLIKSTDDSKSVFKFVYEKMEPVFKTAIYQDQTALEKVVKDMDILKLIDGHIFNAYNKDLTISPINQQNENTFIVHIAGGEGMKRNNLDKIKTLFSTV